jgi:hypothetical protein
MTEPEEEDESNAVEWETPPHFGEWFDSEWDDLEVDA